jgi:hypothetical protein
MSLEKLDIDRNRRDFIKASLVLTGAFMLGKISGLFFPPFRVVSATSAVSPLPDMKEYQDVRYGFSLRYPSNLTVATFDEGEGAATVTFQNIEKGEGFQIFIVPHEDSQVSEQRFAQDVPSGVREFLANIMVDGAIGATFDSTHTTLGTTHEIWFVRGGFLYEVTTPKPLETWLGTIIKTWRFA